MFGFKDHDHIRLKAGEQIGDYRIVSAIGSGGMGDVYLAEDERLGRKVAVNLLPSSISSDRDRLRRFEQEARAASALNHPNIITIHEIGRTDNNHYIATELIEGETLRHRLSRGRLPVPEIMDIAIQVASALAAAHKSGIIHRDIKPENIMLREDGIVKVLDFGLAKLTEKKVKATDLEASTVARVNTEMGVVMGTVNYMSPEQARGKPVDARSDIFSLGVVLYEMATGSAPFVGETSSDVLAGLLGKDPLALERVAPEAPRNLHHIVSKALPKDKEGRYQTVKSMLADLKTLKQEIEFEEKLGRSPGQSFVPTTDDTAPPSSAAGTQEATTKSGDAVGPPPASSAEYIVSQIKSHQRGAALLGVLLIAVAATAYVLFRSGSGPAGINSIAVLPFVNQSDDPNMEYVSDGISESLINSLSELPQLKVIARSSAFKYKGKEVDPEEVAKALGVQAIVAGRIVELGDNLQIRVELVNALDKTEMWGEQYNRKATDLLAVQAEISSEIAERLRLKLTNTEQQRLARRETANPQAYDLLLKGLFYFNRGRSEDWKKAIEYFQQAVAVDPNYALAYAELAIGYQRLSVGSLLDPKQGMPKAEAAARRALELDDSLAEAHYALAYIKRSAWEWAAAEQEYKRAIELNPNLASAHISYSVFLGLTGRQERAVAEAKRATDLDPLSLPVSIPVAGAFYWAHQYEGD